MEKIVLPLVSGWNWRMKTPGHDLKPQNRDRLRHWTSVTQFPSVIQQELLHHGHIPDYKVEQNERLIQWVGECDWEYRCLFETPKAAVEFQEIDMVFEGLDTFATVFINGQEILTCENMHHGHRVNVKQFLHFGPGSHENEMVILFESALRKGTELEETYGARTSIMRDKRRMHTRKAQYHYGWDWGPKVITCGPYRPIQLEMYTSGISYLYVHNELSSDHSQADITIEVALLAETNVRAGRIKIIILNQIGDIIQSRDLRLEEPLTTKIEIKNPEMWWPNGHGKQYLYTAKALLYGEGGSILDTTSSRFGIRTIKLIQRALLHDPGTTFMFNINGKDIFSQGANWIPADNILPAISRSRYLSWIKLAKRCNFNMLRVWGGGIYEPADFWDACDEMGIMVWHDFAFSSGDYPVHAAFLQSIQKEAEQQVLRMRNRASLVLLCGGNEDFMWSKEEYDHSDLEGPFENTGFPQREIYLNILKKVSETLCPEVPYWPSSPWAGAPVSDPTVGDIHQWGVWHLDQLPYQKYKDLGGRFVSEFGMQALPELRTVNMFAPAMEDRHPQSRTFDCHNKADGNLRLVRYLSENIRVSMKLEDYIYSSQFIQSEAYGYAFRDWKRKYGGKGREACAGALVWQFNDVYPCTSWSFVDYFLRPKPSFYTIRRTLDPISIGIERTPASLVVDEESSTTSNQSPEFEIFAHNDNAIPVSLTLALRAFDLKTGHYISGYDQKLPVSLPPGQNSELRSIQTPFGVDETSLVVICAKLEDPTGRETLARFVNWPEPYRYLPIHRNTKVSVIVKESGALDGFEDIVEVEASWPVKGCLLYTSSESGEEAEFEDNMLDLMPDEPISVRVRGLAGKEIKVRFLYDWELN